MVEQEHPVTVKNPRTLAVDVGGSGIKVLILDEAGEAQGDRVRAVTPRPAIPRAVIETIVTLAAPLQYDRVAVGFPGVVRQGVTITAPNLHTDFHLYPFAATLAKRLGRPVRVANDADVQGFGAIMGEGLEMVLTLGTGLGSALFVDGILVPNLELAHHPFLEGKTYEQWLGQASLDELGNDTWLKWLDKAIDQIRNTFNFDVLYLGGGNARLLNPGCLPGDVRVTQNIAGLLGGIALWTDMHGTHLVRAPHSEGAYCALEPHKHDTVIPKN
jgi:polyphosphate glucokinase